MQILLLILLFTAGLLGRQRGWLQPRHGAWLLNLVMMVGLPALFLANISRLTLTPHLLWLPGISAAVMLASWGLGTVAGRALDLPRQTFGAFLICAIAINGAFLFPFVLAGWGESAFAQLALFDLGTATLQCTLVYGVAAHYGGHDAGVLQLLRRLASFPPLWALVLALGLKLAGVALPPMLLDVCSFVGRIILLSVILAIGVLFDARQVRSPAILTAIGLRMGGGLLLGLLCVTLLGLEGETRAVVLLGASAPIGFNVMVMANRESLDREFAASAASLSVLLALVYVPLALLLYKPA